MCLFTTHVKDKCSTLKISLKFQIYSFDGAFFINVNDKT